MDRYLDMLLGCILGVGIGMLVFAGSLGCTQFKAARYAEPVCEMACDDAELATVDTCHGICDNALAGRAIEQVVGEFLVTSRNTRALRICWRSRQSSLIHRKTGH